MSTENENIINPEKSEEVEELEESEESEGSEGSEDSSESDDSGDDSEEYETVDITENEQYQVGSVFFENQDGEGLADIITNLVKVKISEVDSLQALIRTQEKQITATTTLAKVVQKYCKKLDDKI